MEIQCEYTDSDIDFGRTNDTPLFHYVKTFDIDQQIIRVPFSNTIVLVSELLDTYWKITSLRGKFKAKPCLRILTGKYKKTIADPKKSLQSFGFDLKKVCFRIEDSEVPNEIFSDVMDIINEKSQLQIKEQDQVEISFLLSGKKIKHPSNKKFRIGMLKQNLVQTIGELKKISSESVVLQLQGVLMQNEKKIEDYDFEKEIKIFIKRKEGSYKANTQVMMANKTYLAICKIKSGDRILTLNRYTLDLQEATVTEINESFVTESVVIKLKNGVEIESTSGHLLFCEDGAFRLIKSKDEKQISLEAGQNLKLSTQKLQEIQSIKNNFIPPEAFYSISADKNKNIIINHGVISHHQCLKVKSADGLIKSIDVVSSDTIKQIKQKIQIHSSFNAANQRLIYCTKKLKDEEAIIDKNIPNEANIHLQKIPFSRSFNLLHPDSTILVRDKNHKHVKVTELKQDYQLICYNTEQTAKIKEYTTVTVEEYLVISFNSKDVLKVTPETYILTKDKNVILASELFEIYESCSPRFWPKLISYENQTLTLDKIQLVRSKTNFSKITTEGLNFICNNLIIPNCVVNLVIQPNGRRQQKITFNLPKDTNILDIKIKLEPIIKIVPQKQFFSFNGEGLMNSCNLIECNVQNDHVIVVRESEKVYQSSVFFEDEDEQETIENKNITFQFVSGQKYVLKYWLFKQWLIKDILKQYMNTEDPACFLIFSEIKVFFYQQLNKLEESQAFKLPFSTVLVIKNQKISFISTIQIESQKIKNCSCIVFNNKSVLGILPEQSMIKVPQSQDLTAQFTKSSTIIKKKQQQSQLSKQYFYQPFLYFTSRRYHKEIYNCIRRFDEYREEVNKDDSLFSIIKDLYCNMNLLNNHLHMCFYGLRNFRGGMFLEKGHTFYWYNFTLAYKNKTKVAEEVRKHSGTLFHIQSTSGKVLDKFSVDPEKCEILFAPFTYFLVQKVTEGEQFDEIWLSEISSPVTFKKNIILWVDDNPHYNIKEYNLILNQKPEIQILQVTSTIAAEKWIIQFGWILNWKGLQFKLISDMGRVEWNGDKKIENREAGIDLIELLYKIKGYTAQTLIFCGNETRGKSIAQKRQIPPERYLITQTQQVLRNYNGMSK